MSQDRESVEIDAEQHSGYMELLEREGVGDEVTRRKMIGAMGGMALAGAALPFAPALVDEAEGARIRARSLGSGPKGTPVAGLIGRIDQVGNQLTGYGFLTSLRGIGSNRLFTVPRGTNFQDPHSTNEGEAKLTFFSRSRITSLTAQGKPGGPPGDLSVIVANVAGNLNLHFRSGGGADFDSPTSFQGGRRVAGFRGKFQDELTMQPPDFRDLASVHLVGNLRQTERSPFQLGGRRRRIGAQGAKRVLYATGWGELTDENVPESTIWLAGTLVAA